MAKSHSSKERGTHQPTGKPGHKPWNRDHRGPRREPAAQADGSIALFGYHPVREALRSSRRELVKLLATEQSVERVAAELASRGLTPEIVDGSEIARRLPPDAVHQGLLLFAKPLPAFELDELPEHGLVLVLDQVTDPHNVGAMVRTAAAFKVDAIVTTERHSPAMSGILAKSASGGLEHVPLCTVVNLARALDEIGDLGYLRIGLDSDAPTSLESTPISRPLALVLGAEGKGLRRLTRERCDVLARLELPGAIRSLNVSNACAVALTIARMKIDMGKTD